MEPGGRLGHEAGRGFAITYGDSGKYAGVALLPDTGAERHPGVCPDRSRYWTRPFCKRDGGGTSGATDVSR